MTTIDTYKLAQAACGVLVLMTGVAIADESSQASAVDRQSLDDAWWTGPILAASAGTLPRGHFLVEPYLYDSITYGRYDTDGDRSNTPDTNSFGSQTYLLYGLTQ